MRRSCATGFGGGGGSEGFAVAAGAGGFAVVAGGFAVVAGGFAVVAGGFAVGAAGFWPCVVGRCAVCAAAEVQIAAANNTVKKEASRLREVNEVIG